MKKYLNRRNLFKLGAATIVSVPLLKMKNLFADELAWDACPTVVPEEIKKKLAKEKAKARLKFVTDATTSTHKKYEPGAACGNCKFYKAKIVDGNFNDKEIEGYAKCSMLGNRYVSRCGWCNKYKVKDTKYEVYKRLKS